MNKYGTGKLPPTRTYRCPLCEHALENTKRQMVDKRMKEINTEMARLRKIVGDEDRKRPFKLSDGGVIIPNQ